MTAKGHANPPIQPLRLTGGARRLSLGSNSLNPLAGERGCYV